MTEGICSTCTFGDLDFPPTPGGATDGVNCSNPDMVDLLDSEEAREEWAEHGSLNLWRVEVAVPSSTCPAWKAK